MTGSTSAAQSTKCWGSDHTLLTEHTRSYSWHAAVKEQWTAFTGDLFYGTGVVPPRNQAQRNLVLQQLLHYGGHNQATPGADGIHRAALLPTPTEVLDKQPLVQFDRTVVNLLPTAAKTAVLACEEVIKRLNALYHQSLYAVNEGYSELIQLQQNLVQLAKAIEAAPDLPAVRHYTRLALGDLSTAPAPEFPQPAAGESPDQIRERFSSHFRRLQDVTLAGNIEQIRTDQGPQWFRSARLLSSIVGDTRVHTFKETKQRVIPTPAANPKDEFTGADLRFKTITPADWQQAAKAVATQKAVAATRAALHKSHKPVKSAGKRQNKSSKSQRGRQKRGSHTDHPSRRYADRSPPPSEDDADARRDTSGAGATEKKKPPPHQSKYKNTKRE